jgi:hypothetical protein
VDARSGRVLNDENSTRPLICPNFMLASGPRFTATPGRQVLELKIGMEGIGDAKVPDDESVLKIFGEQGGEQ